MVGALGHEVAVRPLEGLGTEKLRQPHRWHGSLAGAHVTDLRENPGHSPGEPPCLVVLHVRCRTSAVSATTLGEDNW